jgi:hypothetical protein
MPEITVTHIALLAAALIIGVVIGWIFRGNKGSSEKAAINLGWQEQLEAQRHEHERLLDQNKSLMEQIFAMAEMPGIPEDIKKEFESEKLSQEHLMMLNDMRNYVISRKQCTKVIDERKDKISEVNFTDVCLYSLYTQNCEDLNAFCDWLSMTSLKYNSTPSISASFNCLRSEILGMNRVRRWSQFKREIADGDFDIEKMMVFFRESLTAPQTLTDVFNKIQTNVTILDPKFDALIKSQTGTGLTSNSSSQELVSVLSEIPDGDIKVNAVSSEIIELLDIEIMIGTKTVTDATETLSLLTK